MILITRKISKEIYLQCFSNTKIFPKMKNKIFETEEFQFSKKNKSKTSSYF